MLNNHIKKKNVEMNYRNYEGKIVEKYGVKLNGWPTSKPGVCNPASLGGRLQLEKLLVALESRRCHWVVLTDDELEERKKQNQVHEERGEQVYRPCKSANQHRTSKGAKSAETIEDSEDEDSMEHEPVTKAHTDNEDIDGGDDGLGDNMDTGNVGDDD